MARRLEDTLIALVRVGNSYHGGGASRGYRLMTKAARGLARRGYLTGGYVVLDTRPTRRQTRIACEIIARHAGGL
jgi:predicted alpha/beta-hydrolase family hydrolase